MRTTPATPARSAPSGAFLALSVLVLFLVWSSTFIAFEYLLDPAQGAARLDWKGLMVARYVPVGMCAAVWCFVFRRAESLAIVHKHWRRLLLCGFFCVPGYNAALYYGMEHHVAAPVASVVTTLSPLYLMLLSAAFLGEKLNARKLLGFAVALSGVVLIAFSRPSGGGSTYPLIVALTACAPLSWAIYSAMTKPVSGTCSPILWTYLVLAIGSLPILALMPFAGVREVMHMNGMGLFLLAYLIFPATIFGYAVWTWLLRHLPATTVGFTIFLNPPLTTAMRFLLVLVLPLSVLPVSLMRPIALGEWIGGGIAMLGVAVAIWRRR